MPELPEVETTKNGLIGLTGAVLTDYVLNRDTLRWPIDAPFDQLLNRTLERIERRAKYLIFVFEAGKVLVHLGMSGSLRVEAKGSSALKHDHVLLEFKLKPSSPLAGKFGQTLVVHYHDPRRFGAVLNYEAHKHKLAHLGPEPLTSEFSAGYLHAKAGLSKRSVKTFVMDQAVVVGVGNIYASESLFLARIAPHKPANKLTQRECAALVVSIKEVIGRAIEMGGSSLKDYINSSGETGYFQQTLNVYGRANQPCVNCGTVLTGVRLGQRATVFCPNCQK